MRTDTPTPASFGNFTISRLLQASPARVFAAWATQEGKQRWFKALSGEWEQIERRVDFRIGGQERLAGKWKNGMVTDFTATYHDIVPNERVIYAYDLLVDGKKISVSLATVEIRAEGNATRMTVTEQGAFLDGYEDKGSRERGTTAQMDALAASLED